MSWRGIAVHDAAGVLQEVHVVPTGEDGVIRPPHVLSADCPCGPIKETPIGGVVAIYTHEVLRVCQ